MNKCRLAAIALLVLFPGCVSLSSHKRGHTPWVVSYTIPF